MTVAVRPMHIAPAAEPVTGQVCVIAAKTRHRQASCTCGWEGPRRWWLPQAAVVDALDHAAYAGCKPERPLITHRHLRTVPQPR
jgi:hypothetical protein